MAETADTWYSTRETAPIIWSHRHRYHVIDTTDLVSKPCHLGKIWWVVPTYAFVWYPEPAFITIKTGNYSYSVYTDNPEVKVLYAGSWWRIRWCNITTMNYLSALVETRVVIPEKRNIATWRSFHPTYLDQYRGCVWWLVTSKNILLVAVRKVGVKLVTGNR